MIRRVARENPLWGAPRVHGELLMLGLVVSETTVGKYMPRSERPPSQNWRAFLMNHGFVACDFFTVPTLTFGVLYVFVVLRHRDRRLLHVRVTANPTAAWSAQQMREAFPFDEAPRYLLRDNDSTPVPSSLTRSSVWASRKFERPREVLGKIHSSKELSDPSGASVWTTSSL